jgi:hypothetical protein
LRPPGNIQTPSRFRLTRSTRPRFAATSFEDFAISYEIHLSNYFNGHLFDGPIDGESFRIYDEKVLVPTLRPGDIVIMDNLGSHKAKAVRQLIRAAGAKALLPAEMLAGTEPDRTGLRQAHAFVAQGRRALGQPSASQSAKSSEHLRPPNAPTISETQAMPNPESIML